MHSLGEDCRSTENAQQESTQPAQSDLVAVRNLGQQSAKPSRHRRLLSLQNTSKYNDEPPCSSGLQHVDSGAQWLHVESM